jgi:sugar O-acyltransferase (sialic acid O-acetyltransferase NeuD family)
MPEPQVPKGNGATDGILNASNVACKRELVIVGAGGYGSVAASVADDINTLASKHDQEAPWDVVGYADSDATKIGRRHAGRAVLGTIEEVDRDFHGRDLWFFCAIGDNDARAKIVRLAKGLGWKPATLVHPSAILAGNVEIGAGSYIGPASVVSVDTKIGAHVIIDMHVSIGHDAVLKDFCAVFPGARISGCCCLGEYALVGSNATLLPGTKLGERAVVGASSLAHGSVEPDTTILGVPGRVVHRRRSSLSRQ